MPKIAIVGSRDICVRTYLKNSYQLITSAIEHSDIELIVSGGSKDSCGNWRTHGADTIAALVAEAFKIPLKEFLPDWTTYGKAAGPLRNTDIVNLSDIGFALLNKSLRESRGTHDTVKKFIKAGKPIFLIDLLRCTIEEHKTIPVL